MNQRLEITMERCTVGTQAPWMSFTLCGTLDVNGVLHDHSDLLLLPQKKELMYCNIGEIEVFTCEMHQLFDSSSVQAAIDSLALWHRDFLNTHGITIPAYDSTRVETIELPPDVL